ncbi:MAG TPA: DUF2269 family protein [Anaerolineales bacterium]|nr:DUF2269 family protein [Anaerolineales bacterium]
MFVFLLVRFLHIGGAILLVGGIFARQLARSRANRAADPATLAAIMQAADPIERTMVIPGSFAAVVSGVILALRTGAPIFGFLQGAAQNWLLLANVLILLTIPLVPLVFVPRGKVFERHLRQALDQGVITPAVRASLNDPVVGFAHTFEMVALALVVILMVFKPV